MPLLQPQVDCVGAVPTGRLCPGASRLARSPVLGVICSCVKNAFKPVPGFLTFLREKTDALFNPFLHEKGPIIWGFRKWGQAREFLAPGPQGLMRAWCSQDLNRVSPSALSRISEGQSPQKPAAYQGPD